MEANGQKVGSMDSSKTYCVEVFVVGDQSMLHSALPLLDGNLTLKAKDKPVFIDVPFAARITLEPGSKLTISTQLEVVKAGINS